jgi:N-acyl amino acid synthase of PEP-CTERM/exosortase system
MAHGLTVDTAPAATANCNWRAPSSLQPIVIGGAGLPGLRIVHADTPELRRIAYRLRYDVYCIENPFFDPADCVDQLETDEFDARSLHALLQHEASGTFMGTVRLILPRDGERPFTMPFASLCHDSGIRVDDFLPTRSTAEVSRFAVSKSFRRRATDGLYPDQFESPVRMAADRRVMPSLSLALIAAVTHMGLAAGVTHVCAVMEPSLLRLLRRLGIEFNPVGPPVEYHGLRQPCFADASVLLAQVRIAQPGHWNLMTSAGSLVGQGARSSVPPAMAA